jgi:hypothetical protein
MTMNDQEKKTSDPDATQNAAGETDVTPPAEQPGAALKNLSGRDSGRVDSENASTDRDDPIDGGSSPHAANRPVDEISEDRIERILPKPSAADQLPWWQKIIPGRKRDVQLAEIKSGYDEVLGLIRSMRENLDAQVVGQKKLVEFMSELPDVAEGLRNMGEAAAQQKEVMSALKDQMASNVQQNASIASSMDKFNGTLHSMDETTRQILQGARQTENSLKSLLERSERRLMIMTSLVILLLVAVGVSVVVISKNSGSPDAQQNAVSAITPPADVPSPPDAEPVPDPEQTAAPIDPSVEDALEPPTDEPDSAEQTGTDEVSVPVEPADPGSSIDTTSSENTQADEPGEEGAVSEDSDENVDAAPLNEDGAGDETSAVPVADDQATDSDETETSVDTPDKPKRSWLSRNLFGKNKDDKTDDLSGEKGKDEPAVDEDQPDKPSGDTPEPGTSADSSQDDS